MGGAALVNALGFAGTARASPITYSRPQSRSSDRAECIQLPHTMHALQHPTHALQHPTHTLLHPPHAFHTRRTPSTPATCLPHPTHALLHPTHASLHPTHACHTQRTYCYTRRTHCHTLRTPVTPYARMPQHRSDWSRAATAPICLRARSAAPCRAATCQLLQLSGVRRAAREIRDDLCGPGSHLQPLPLVVLCAYAHDTHHLQSKSATAEPEPQISWALTTRTPMSTHEYPILNRGIE
jgi:hypothetical protein